MCLLLDLVLKLLLLGLYLLLLLLILDAEAGKILLGPFQSVGGKVASSDASKDQRNHGRRNAAL